MTASKPIRQLQSIEELGEWKQSKGVFGGVVVGESIASCTPRGTRILFKRIMHLGNNFADEAF
jgi:hypothetical protein